MRYWKYCSSEFTTWLSDGGTPVNVANSNGQVVQLRDNQIFRPSLTSSTNRIAYANNMIPEAEFSPAAVALLNFSRGPIVRD